MSMVQNRPGIDSSLAHWSAALDFKLYFLNFPAFSADEDLPHGHSLHTTN